VSAVAAHCRRHWLRLANRPAFTRLEFAPAFATICLGFAAPSLASDPLSALLACRDVADPTARLACFDRAAAVPPAKAAVTITPTPVPTSSVSTAPVQQAPVLDPQQQFGLPERAVVAKEVAAGTRAADAGNIQAHITRVDQAADGRTIFTLDNDQVWRQLLTEGDLLTRPGDLVTISRAFLGSYWLQTASGRGCKVTRLR
jgi:hypothetical protein